MLLLPYWISYSYLQARGNAILQASLERRKQALHERRLALEQDVFISIRILGSTVGCFI
ncbi:unnamed protein product [Linum tenue]|uniref:Uncharacterized protein n=1 Tax=Linum tenue TaxID=586396 RepID=A0AAV0QT46_9ROSI|nr:unnamed protein product [Linum tenue]